jgi:Domain of unknown function (DUF5655)
MTTIRDWQENRAMWVRVLEKQTNQKLEPWNRVVRETLITNEHDLRAWLTDHGVTGYAQTLLVMERFGYPDFLTATAEELIARQYEGRSHLRTIYDAIIDAARECGAIIIQARKTYVSLVAPRRTFARIKPVRNQVDLGLRLKKCEPIGRIEPARIHHTMTVQIGLTSLQDVDPKVRYLLAQAYLENS